MAFGEAIVRERGELQVDLIGDVAGDATLGHARVELGLQTFHALLAAFGSHGLAQLVGVARAEPRDVDCHLHELLLEERHAEGLRQRFLEQGMQVCDRLFAVAPTDVRVHRTTLDGAGADERHLDDKVVERTRPQPRQRGHLCTRLDLEHPDGIGFAQHVVDRVLLGDGGEVDVATVVRTDEIDGVVQGAEHAQAEEVELDEPGGRAVVLVPLQHAAPGHATPFDRAHLDDGAIADDHAPRVDAEVAREVLDLACELEDIDRQVAGIGDRRPPIGGLRERVLLAACVPERLGHVTDGRLRAVGDDVRDLCRVVAPVRVIDVLDDLLATVALDVDVDVGRTVTLGRQEAFEQQPEHDGVGVGDAERVADRGVRS